MNGVLSFCLVSCYELWEFTIHFSSNWIVVDVTVDVLVLVLLVVAEIDVVIAAVDNGFLFYFHANHW